MHGRAHEISTRRDTQIPKGSFNSFSVPCLYRRREKLMDHSRTLITNFCPCITPIRVSCRRRGAKSQHIQRRIKHSMGGNLRITFHLLGLPSCPSPFLCLSNAIQTPPVSPSFILQCSVKSTNEKSPHTALHKSHSARVPCTQKQFLTQTPCHPYRVFRKAEGLQGSL